MKKQASHEVQLIKVNRAHLGLHFTTTQASSYGVCQPLITSGDTPPCPGTKWKLSSRGSRSLKMLILEFMLVAIIPSSFLCLTFLRRPHRELLIQPHKEDTNILSSSKPSRTTYSSIEKDYVVNCLSSCRQKTRTSYSSANGATDPHHVSLHPQEAKRAAQGLHRA